MELRGEEQRKGYGKKDKFKRERKQKRKGKFKTEGIASVLVSFKM